MKRYLVTAAALLLGALTPQAATTNMADNPHICYQTVSVKKQGKNPSGVVERIQTETKKFTWAKEDWDPLYNISPQSRYTWSYVDDPLPPLEVYYKDKTLKKEFFWNVNPTTGWPDGRYKLVETETVTALNGTKSTTTTISYDQTYQAVMWSSYYKVSGWVAVLDARVMYGIDEYPGEALVEFGYSFLIRDEAPTGIFEYMGNSKAGYENWNYGPAQMHYAPQLTTDIIRGYYPSGIGSIDFGGFSPVVPVPGTLYNNVASVHIADAVPATTDTAFVRRPADVYIVTP